MWPGDLVTAVYDKHFDNNNTNWVIDTWVISRGSVGKAVGQTPFSGFIPVNDTNHGELNVQTHPKVIHKELSRTNH